MGSIIKAKPAKHTGGSFYLKTCLLKEKDHEGDGGGDSSNFFLIPFFPASCTYLRENSSNETFAAFFFTPIFLPSANAEKICPSRGARGPMSAGGGESRRTKVFKVGSDFFFFFFFHRTRPFYTTAKTRRTTSEKKGWGGGVRNFL